MHFCAILPRKQQQLVDNTLVISPDSSRCGTKGEEVKTGVSRAPEWRTWKSPKLPQEKKKLEASKFKGVRKELPRAESLLLLSDPQEGLRTAEAAAQQASVRSGSAQSRSCEAASVRLKSRWQPKRPKRKMLHRPWA